MKDYFGRDINEGDLVISKATGRNSSMRHGIALETGSVWFGPNSTGGAWDKFRVDTRHDEDLEKIRLDLVEARNKYIKECEQEKRKKKKQRIKKKEFRRFHCYDGEIYIGKAFVDGEETDSLWVKVSRKDYRIGHVKSNIGINLLYTYGYLEGAVNSSMYRFVKYPQKFKEEFSFTKDEVEQMLQGNYDKVDTYSKRKYKNYIEIIN